MVTFQMYCYATKSYSKRIRRFLSSKSPLCEQTPLLSHLIWLGEAVQSSVLSLAVQVTLADGRQAYPGGARWFSPWGHGPAHCPQVIQRTGPCKAQCWVVNTDARQKVGEIPCLLRANGALAHDKVFMHYKKVLTYELLAGNTCLCIPYLITK